MHKLVVLYPPPTDPDAFRSYYEIRSYSSRSKARSVVVREFP